MSSSSASSPISGNNNNCCNNNNATTPTIINRDQQFCLRWNNYQNNLTQVFNQLFQSESFVDVTLACEGHSVRAHKLVLSACSPYFQNVLSQTPCSHPVIILQGVKWAELKSVVEFMYKGEINVIQEQLGPLLRVAESLKIRGLTDVGGGEEAEAVITSPTGSPRAASSQFWGADETPRKRRRLSTEDSSRSSHSRTPTPGRPNTPASLVGNCAGGAVNIGTGVGIVGAATAAGEVLESPCASSTSSSNPAPVPSPVASLASSLSSFAHFHAPMPPPGPQLPAHLAHLPPLSPLSPLLNMHPMNRHQSPEDFEIRPGIAEMIREEERAKLIESTHHWMSNPMADSYQAQVQAAWQKSWNQTQSLLQNLRFRERGPLKSWRPETMAEAIHAVLKEGLSLSQSARKYDIPYPTFVLYANRVHNLLGPSHEPGDMRPKGRGRPQRILLGSWPEDQIKGVIRAVVFRDTTVFRDTDHKENKKPALPPTIKNEVLAHGGPFTPSSNGDKSGPSTPIPPSTPGTSQPLPPGGGIMPPLSTPPTPNISKQDIGDITDIIQPGNVGPHRPNRSASAGHPAANGHSPKMNGTVSPPKMFAEGGSEVASYSPGSSATTQMGSRMSPAGTQQQMLDLLSGAAGGLSPSSHMARLFSENSRGGLPPPINSFPSGGYHPTHARGTAPGIQALGINGLINSLGGGQQHRIDEPDPSPETLLFGKMATSTERYNEGGSQRGSGVTGTPSFEQGVETPTGDLDRPLQLFRDSMDVIKSEPEAIMN